MSRPYRAWGYPLIPALYLLITLAFLINTLIEKPVQAVAGLLVLGVGVVLFYQFKQRRNLRDDILDD